MKKLLSWDQIKQNYSGQWVELMDCEWEWHEALPRSARVSASSSDRSSLLSQARERGNSQDSIILLIGSTRTVYNSHLESPSSEATL